MMEDIFRAMEMGFDVPMEELLEAAGITGDELKED